MSAMAPPIGIADVPGGYLVSLPPRLALVVSLRKCFPKTFAADTPWTYVVPRPATRLGEWLAEIELQTRRIRRSWCASDVEWGDVPASAPAVERAVAPAIIRLPPKRTAKSVLALLDRLAAGETMIAESGGFSLFPSGRPVPACAARRAIEQRLIVPSCDGLFGPETSQSWRAPTQEETDAAAERSREVGPAGAQARQDGRSRSVRGPAPRRPRGAAWARTAGAAVADDRRRGAARRDGGVA